MTVRIMNSNIAVVLSYYFRHGTYQYFFVILVEQ